MRWLLAVAVGARLVAAVVLLFGPWTNSAAELEGWDVSRFQQIVDEPGRPWADHEVEYPPGSVIAVEAVSVGGRLVPSDDGDVVGTSRALILSSLVVDLGLAAFLRRRFGPPAGLGYLLLGLPLVPAGLLRFDLWAALAAVVGFDALARRRSSSFAVATTVGAAIKVFPALLIPLAVAAGRTREALIAVAAGAVAIAAWLAYGGPDGPEQVLSLRGVTGWHVESLPGSLAALFSDAEPRFEADAFRVGTLSNNIVAVGRVVALATVVGLGWLLHRSRRHCRRPRQHGATMMLGSVAALIVTAPLLSPQFILWLTPWAALLAAPSRRQPLLVWLTLAAAGVTAMTLAMFGPPSLDGPVPATLLLARDVVLIGIVAGSAVSLRGCGPAGSGSCGTEDSLWTDRPGPRPTGSQSQVDEMTEEHQALSH